MRRVKRHTFWMAPLVLAAAAPLACDESAMQKPAPVGSADHAATASASARPTATASAKRRPAPPVIPPPTVATVFPELAFHSPMEVPDDNVPTTAKIELGKMLFFDKRIGKDGKMSCESCHFIDLGMADGKALSTKADGKDNTRHTPALWNIGYQEAWYWDGRAETLEAQVLAAWKGQMGADPEKATAAIASIEGYQKAFKEAYGGEPTPGDVVKALASFVRSLRSGDAPFDLFQQGDQKAVSESAARGWEIFREKGGCAACHAPPMYTDNIFHNVGVGYDKPEPDLGRALVTKRKDDEGKFKTPSLRSVSTHPPYFHDGSAKTLEEAVDFMAGGGRPNPNLDGSMKKVDLTAEERADLIAFLKALTPEGPKMEKPELPK